MKILIMILITSLAFTSVAQAKKTVTSEELVMELMKMTEGAKSLDSSCSIYISVSTEKDVFATIVMIEKESRQLIEFTLNYSQGEIETYNSGNSGASVRNYKTSKGLISLTSIEDMADVYVKISVGGKNLECGFKE